MDSLLHDAHRRWLGVSRFTVYMTQEMAWCESFGSRHTGSGEKKIALRIACGPPPRRQVLFAGHAKPHLTWRDGTSRRAAESDESSS